MALASITARVMSFDFEVKSDFWLKYLMDHMRIHRDRVPFDWTENRDQFLQRFLGSVWPSGSRQTVIVASAALDSEDAWRWQMRPSPGPAVDRLVMDGGFVPSFGFYWRKGVFVVDAFKPAPNVGPREYEAEMIGEIHTDAGFEMDWAVREELLELPTHRAETSSQLTDWYGYLEWMEGLIEGRQIWLKYTDLEVGGGLLTFKAWIPGKEWNQIKKTRFDIFSLDDSTPSPGSRP